MAIVYSYPTAPPESQDLLIGVEMAVQGGEGAPRTKTFTIGSIVDLATPALDLKANIESPTFTGTVTTNLDAIINGIIVGNGGGDIPTNTATGDAALYSNNLGSSNTANGNYALHSNTSGDNNTATGSVPLFSNTTGSNNTGIGFGSLYNAVSLDNNTAIGYNSLSNNTLYSNCSALGASATVTDSNQVQLGDSTTTTYVYGTVQNRSDLRDKTEVRDTVLGLDFINELRPVDYKWDMREDYKTETSSKLNELIHDGTHTRSRFHHGLIAQEVKTIIETNGIDFGGFQDHSINGGEDVLSIGYDELIGPMIKAIQELKAEIELLKSK